MNLWAKLAVLFFLTFTGGFSYRIYASSDESLGMLTERLKTACLNFELWSPNAQTRTKERDALFSRCRGQVDALNRFLFASKSISFSEKRSAEEQIEVLLRIVQSTTRSRLEWNANRNLAVYRSELAGYVALEHGLRLALSRLAPVQVWHAQWSNLIGLQEQAGSPGYLFGASLLLEIDFGQSLTGLAEVATLTPRHEADGLILLPPNSANIFGIQQMWASYWPLSRLQVFLGNLPDSDHPLRPQKWPFFSVGTKVIVFESYDTTLDLKIRHDTHGVWDYISKLHEPTQVERNHSQLVLRNESFSPLGSKLEWDLGLQVDWYSDPQFTLTRLGLGRRVAVESAEGTQQSYRVSSLFARLLWSLQGGFGLKGDGTFFWNHLKESASDADFLQGGIFARSGSWLGALDLYFARIACFCAPPVQLTEFVFPDQKIFGFKGDLTYFVNPELQFETEFRLQSVEFLTQREDCPYSQSTRNHELNRQFLFGILLKFQ